MDEESTALALQITNLRKSYPGRAGEPPVEAVKGINVTVPKGEIVAFLGPNGAGKTTTLDMVLGLTDPTSGSITVLGQKPRQAVHAGKVSAVLQTGGLLANLKVGETVEVIAALHGVRDRVPTVMEQTGLTRLANRKVSLCSGGEQQRLRFALALLPDPDLLILDEPTAGMDPTARRDFWDVMRAETHAGRTVIFATHYLEEAQNYAERVVLIDKGVIVADQSIQELRAMAGARQVHATIGDAAAREQAVSALTAMPGVHEIRREGERLVISASASDDVALALLAQHGGSDLVITQPSLESAFFALTGDATAGVDSIDNTAPVQLGAGDSVAGATGKKSLFGKDARK